MLKFRTVSAAMVICLTAGVCLTPSAAAETKARHQVDVDGVKALEKKANQRCEALIDAQRMGVMKFATMERFKKLAEEIVSFAEKLQQGQDLLNSSDRSGGRIQQLQRRLVYDDSTLGQELRTQFMKLQAQLIEETLLLCRTAGISDQQINQTFRVWVTKENAWEGTYDTLIRRAVSISQSDWMREVLEWIGSDIGGDAIEEVARGVGLWNHEEGSWADLIGGFVADLVVEQVINEVTDPIGEIASTLQQEFRSCTTALMDGRNGFGDACREMTRHHLEGRRKVLGLPAVQVQK